MLPSIHFTNIMKPLLPPVGVLNHLVHPEGWQVSLEVVGQELGSGILRAARPTVARQRAARRDRLSLGSRRPSREARRERARAEGGRVSWRRRELGLFPMVGFPQIPGLELALHISVRDADRNE